MKTVMIGMTMNESAVNAYFSKLAEVFKSHSYKVVILADNNCEELVNRESNPIVLTWPSKRPTTWNDAKFFIEEVRRYQPDIVIGNFASVNIMNVVGFFLRIPLRLAWAHSVSTAFGKVSFVSKARKQFVYKFSTNIIANSNAMRTDLVQYNKLNANKINVYTNAIKLTNHDNENIERDPNLFLYVGGIYANKGIETLIDAFVLVHEKFPRICLKIVGPGKGLEALQNSVKDRGLSEIINVAGGVHRDNVYREYRTAMCCVVPSKHEAFGYVVVEAMAEMAAVIGSNIEGISEIIDDEVSGLLFKTEDVQDLAEKMERILVKEEERKKYIENAYKTLETKYNLDLILESFVCDFDKKIEKIQERKNGKY